MRFWDNLRTAFTLADRVEEVEKRMNEVESDWTDVEDKLLAREERLRKRMSRELKKALDNGEPVDAPTIVAPAGTQAAKMGIVERFRRSRQEG